MGVDLTKSILLVHGRYDRGNVKFKRAIKRKDFPRVFDRFSFWVVGLEARGSARDVSDSYVYDFLWQFRRIYSIIREFRWCSRRLVIQSL